MSAVKPNKSVFRVIWKARWLYILMLPGLLYFIIYKYIPMFGTVMAFQNYQPMAGFLKSRWVGLYNFQRFFSEPSFWMLMKNTFVLAFYNVILFFPVPIILALLLNEVQNMRFKKLVQTVTYMPHFLSWVVIVGISFALLTLDNGPINNAIEAVGGTKINFMMNKSWFRPLILIQSVWKEAGWSSIVFLAALAGVNIELYESARVEGANRWQQLVNITLPSISGTITTMLILRLGRFLDLGFEHVFLMLNAMNREVGEIFDTYVYSMGILQGQFSYSTAIGLFKSAIALVLVVVANYLAKKSGEEGIF